MLVASSSGAFSLSFRTGVEPGEARLRTRLGEIRLFLGQTCKAVREGQWFRLKTLRYRYFLRAPAAKEPAIRWEYIKEWDQPFCRHHLQGPIDVLFADRRLSLNDVHLPTGFVTIEEVIRFCIVELDARPLSTNWDVILRESYRDFKTKFAPRGSAAD